MAKMIRYNGANYRSIFRFAEVFRIKFLELSLDLYKPLEGEMLELYQHLSEVADGSPIDYFSIEPENHNLVQLVQTLLSRRSPTEELMSFELWVGMVEKIFIEYGLISVFGKQSENVTILRADNYDFLQQPDDVEQWMFIVVDRVSCNLKTYGSIFEVTDAIIEILDASVVKFEEAREEIDRLNETRE